MSTKTIGDLVSLLQKKKKNHQRGPTPKKYKEGRFEGRQITNLPGAPMCLGMAVIAGYMCSTDLFTDSLVI